MFNLLSRFCQAVVVFRPSLRHARLKAVGAIRDAVPGDSLQQLLVELLSMLNTPVALVSDHGLESLEDLRLIWKLRAPRLFSRKSAHDKQLMSHPTNAYLVLWISQGSSI